MRSTTHGLAVESRSDIKSWEAKMSSVFYSYKMSTPGSASFSGTVRSRQMGNITFALIDAQPHEASRLPDASRSRRKDNRFSLSLQLEGRSTISQDGKTRALEPQDCCVYDTGLPYTRRFDEPTQSLVVAFPRAFLMLPENVLHDASALVLKPDGPIQSLYSPLLKGVSQQFESLDELSAYRLARAVVELLSTSLISNLHIETIPKDRTTEQLKLSVLTYISDNIADPELSAGAIAHHFYISTRHLFQLFSGQGIASLIREKRLVTAESMLSDPSLSWATIAQISEMCGFINANYFSRVFRERYGVTPSQLRDAKTG